MEQIKKFVKKKIRNLLPGNSPDFLIIGAQKSGTSSLHHYLTAHPNLVSGQLKENNFFNDPNNYNLGNEWYENHFKHPYRKDKLFYEASPAYLYYKKTAERINKYKPGIKLIVLMREPVSRAYSAWNMYRNFFVNNSIPAILSKSPEGNNNNLLYKFLYNGRDSFTSFRECASHELAQIKSGISTEEPSFIRKGIYYLQLIEYLKYFSRDQLLIFDFKELSENKLELLFKIEEFLGIEHYNFNNSKNVIDKIVISKQKVRYAEKIDDLTKTELTEFYRPWNLKLFELIGKDLKW